MERRLSFMTPAGSAGACDLGPLPAALTQPARAVGARFAGRDVLMHASFLPLLVGISRDSLHKRRATGGKQKAWRKKRK